MALSEAPAWNVLTLKTTVNHCRTIDLSNRVVVDIFLPVSPPLQVYSVVLLDTSVSSEGGGVFSGRFQTGGDRGRARGVWLDFLLSADKLHFTFQLLPVPLDSRQGRDQGPQGGREGSWVDGRRGLDGGGGHWMGGGMLLGGLALEISVVCFSSFQDGRGLELELEFGFGLGGSGWVGVWGLGSQPATAGSLLVSHGQKKQPWTVPGYLSTALQSSPKKTGTQKWGLHRWWHILTAAY